MSTEWKNRLMKRMKRLGHPSNIHVLPFVGNGRKLKGNKSTVFATETFRNLEAYVIRRWKRRIKEFKVSLGYSMRLCLTKLNKNPKLWSLGM